MHKVLEIKNVDGREIATGIFQPSIDPVETQKKIAPLLEINPKLRILRDAIDHHGNLSKRQFGLLKKHRMERNAGKRQRLEAEFRSISQKIETAAARVGELEVEAKEIRKNISQEHAVQFHLPNAIILTDEICLQFKSKLENLGQFELLTSDGNVIPNYKGCVFWSLERDTWKKITIESVDVPRPEGALLYDEMNTTQKAEVQAQVEQSRINELSDADREVERESVLAGLLTQSAVKKAELEILGTDDPLQEAREWYLAQKEIVESRYGAKK